MSRIRMRRLGDATLVASPSLRLVAAAQLSPRLKRAMLVPWAPEPAAVLLPAEGPLVAAEGLSRHGAALWRRLQRPTRLDRIVDPRLGKELSAEIARLVLDGVLMIEAEDGFRTGIAAFPLVFAGAPVGTVAGHTGRLSVQALETVRYAVRSDPGFLASQLYRYNTLPPSRHARRMFGSHSDQPDHGMTPTSLTRASGWTQRTVSLGGAWTQWSRPRLWRQHSRGTYKLYVSPAPRAVDEVLSVTLRSAAESRAVALKVGRGLPGLLRPDKLVVYFAARAPLVRFAKRLARDLAGVPPHGTPFTASLMRNGLLSWGWDPPVGKRDGTLFQPKSWRQRVTEILGRSLAVADGTARESDGVRPWQFAVHRLGLEGVDPSTFASV